ncbi:hypothetical protein HYX13_03825 [Candidatus Woesearchaeota archaeon]|nr:hypothetical protein [Candidatus Woesearchaeota archaeon]
MSKLQLPSTKELALHKPGLVPALFTARQFELLLKKSSDKKLTATEQSYFSRSISPKAKALQSFSPSQKYYVFGSEHILPERKEEAKNLLKILERNHKGLRILITGSFLYSKKHKDIDVFLISIYEKEDFFSQGIHYNYLTPDILGTVFFASLAKLSVSNFNPSVSVTEEIKLSRIISLYQEVLKDVRENNCNWLKRDLRDFLVETTYCRESLVLDSLQIHNRIQRILALKNPISLLAQIFVQTLLLGFKLQEVREASRQMIASYHELQKEYVSADYSELIHSFNEVLQSAA